MRTQQLRVAGRNEEVTHHIRSWLLGEMLCELSQRGQGREGTHRRDEKSSKKQEDMMGNTDERNTRLTLTVTQLLLLWTPELRFSQSQFKLGHVAEAFAPPISNKWALLVGVKGAGGVQWWLLQAKPTFQHDSWLPAGVRFNRNYPCPRLALVRSTTGYLKQGGEHTAGVCAGSTASPTSFDSLPCTNHLSLPSNQLYRTS